MELTGSNKRNLITSHLSIMVCPSETLDSQIYSMQESSNGELSQSYLCHILPVPLFITWCYEYFADFWQHQLHSWWHVMAGHMMHSDVTMTARLHDTLGQILPTKKCCNLITIFIKPAAPVRMSGSRIHKGHTVTCSLSTTSAVDHLEGAPVMKVLFVNHSSDSCMKTPHAEMR